MKEIKKNWLLISAICFFVLINTAYLWENNLGLWAIPIDLILALIYVWLFSLLVREIFFSIKERFRKKKRLLQIGILILVLSLTFYSPAGLIKYEFFESETVLIAEREGAANCLTTLKLKENLSFNERAICFGSSETKGNFGFINDTIFFENVQLGRNTSKFYQFAVIKPSTHDNEKIKGDLILYNSTNDTTGYLLWITKNELEKLKAN